jgi:hypothetical protein
VRTRQAAAIGAAVLGLCAAVRADDVPRAVPDGTTVRPVTARPRMTIGQAIDAIYDAPDPSSTVEAYSRARAMTTTRGVAVAQAYVRRMTEFGLPEMAEAQAKYVLDVELTDPVAKAVIAAMRAKRGETENAIRSIATAVMFGADEPYVRRTAGQILAWHDTRTGTMAEDIESSIATMRRSVEAAPEFKEAYAKARVAYLASHVAAFEAPKADATLVADSIEADFGAEEDEAIIYTSSLASCGIARSFWSPTYWSGWCSTVLRAHDVCAFGATRFDSRFSTRRTYFGRYGYGYGYGGWGRSYATYSTPLGMYSRSVPHGGGYFGFRSYCAPVQDCAPRRSGRGYGRGWR